MKRRLTLSIAITRLRAKRTRAQFARDLGVHRNYPQRWEDGMTPSTEHLQALVKNGLDAFYLLGCAVEVHALDGGEAA